MARLLPACRLRCSFITRLILFITSTVGRLDPLTPLFDFLCLPLGHGTSGGQRLDKQFGVAVSLDRWRLLLAVRTRCCYDLRPDIFDQGLDALLGSGVGLKGCTASDYESDLLFLLLLVAFDFFYDSTVDFSKERRQIELVDRFSRSRLGWVKYVKLTL